MQTKPSKNLMNKPWKSAKIFISHQLRLDYKQFANLVS